MIRQLIGVLLISGLVSCKTYHQVDSSASTTRMNSEIGIGDSTVLKMIEPYKVQLDAEMGRVLTINAKTMDKGKPESTLTNWFADILMQASVDVFETTPDFAVQNYGGIRRSQLPAGEVTVGTIYELMPFDNEMVMVHLTGEKVQEFCDRMAHSGGWPVSKELRFTVYQNKALDVTISGRPLEAEKTYHIVLNDYIANGGDGLEMLRSSPPILSGVLIRDALIDLLDQVEEIGFVKLDGRIKLKED